MDSLPDHLLRNNQLHIHIHYRPHSLLPVTFRDQSLIFTGAGVMVPAVWYLLKKEMMVQRLLPTELLIQLTNNSDPAHRLVQAAGTVYTMEQITGSQ